MSSQHDRGRETGEGSVSTSTRRFIFRSRFHEYVSAFRATGRHDLPRTDDREQRTKRDRHRLFCYILYEIGGKKKDPESRGMTRDEERRRALDERTNCRPPGCRFINGARRRRRRDVYECPRDTTSPIGRYRTSYKLDNSIASLLVISSDILDYRTAHLGRDGEERRVRLTSIDLLTSLRKLRINVLVIIISREGRKRDKAGE